MFDTTLELLEKIRLGEDSFLELKEVRLSGDRVTAPNRDSLADELAAFANARGGVCVLGVGDGTRDIEGIPIDRLDAVEALVGQVCDDSIDPPLVTSINRSVLPTTSGAEVAVIRVDVPRSLFVHRSPGGYLQRLGSSIRKMSVVPIILQRSEALSGKRPEYRVIDDMEVKLTIHAADPIGAGA